MSFIGGYQSNFNLSNLPLVGDFPVDHSLGGFGFGTGLNDYIVTINTTISQYRPGLLLLLMFGELNTSPVRVNVSGCGFKAVKKAASGALLELEPGDINAFKIYLLVYDGSVFQLVNTSSASNAVSAATELQAGIAQIATLTEVQAGLDNGKFVTAAKLASYVAGKITGLWTDKGIINCTGNPDYPPARKGDAYTVAWAGKIGGINGQNVGVRDVIYCNADNAGGSEEQVGYNWTVLQANLEAATELVAGYLRLSTQDEVNTGENTVTAVSPRRLKDMLDSRVASEAQGGLLRIATQAEMNAGLADNKAVSPLKLQALLNMILCFQRGTGVGTVIPKAGADNAAAGNYAAVLNGQNNQAGGFYSQASGLFAEATMFNLWAKAGGAFYNITGSSQSGILNLLGIILPGNTPVTLTADGNNGGTNRWHIPLNCVQQFAAHLTVTQNAGTLGTPGLSWTGIYEGAVRNQNGILDWVGGAPVVRSLHQDPGFDPSPGFDLSSGEIALYVTAMIERTLLASATVYITQTKFLLG